MKRDILEILPLIGLVLLVFWVGTYRVESWIEAQKPEILLPPTYQVINSNEEAELCWKEGKVVEHIGPATLFVNGRFVGEEKKVWHICRSEFSSTTSISANLQRKK